MDIPDAMVEFEADNIMRDYEARISGSGFSFDDYLKMMGTNRAEFRNTAKDSALRQIQADLAFGAVADAENIQPTDEQIADEIKRLAEQYGMEEDKIKENVPQEEIARRLRLELASKLVYDAAEVEAPAAKAKKAAAEE